MLAATFTLTNCAEEIDQPVVDEPVAGVPFEIVASTAETKTVNSGLSTNWAAEDQINLFHAVAGETNYINNNAFVVDEENPVSGRFTGELTAELTAASYDWYALYPYSEYTDTPEASGYLPIGCEPAKSTTQVQEGNSNMKHIAGPNYPLWGNVKDVARDVKPSITMSHVASLLKVVVTNSTEEPLKVETVQFTAPEDIVGTYYITFTGESVSCLGSGENYVSKTATLSVTDGADIPVGETAEFYLAIKPFVAEASAENKLTLSVNGYAKEMPLNQNVTFAAGKFKTLNFNYDKVVEPEPEGTVTGTISFATTDQRTSLTTEEQVWENDNIIFINSKSSSTSNVADYSGPVRLYKNSDITITAPGCLKEIVFECVSSYIDELQNSLVNETITVSGTTVTVALAGDSESVTYTLSGGQIRLNAITVTYMEPDPDAVKIQANDVKDISARGVEAGVLEYEIVNPNDSDLSVECDGTVVTSAELGENCINYSVAPNGTLDPKGGTITIKYGDVIKTVNVSQKASTFTAARSTVDLGSAAGANTTVTITSDFNWTLIKEGEGFSVTPDYYEYDEDGKEIITITADVARTEEGVAELGTITITDEYGKNLTITVTQNTSFEPEVGGDMVTETLTITGTTGVLTDDKLSISWSGTNFTCTNEKASSSTAIRTSDSAHYRVYVGSNLNFSAKNGKTFNKLVLTCVSSYVANETNVTYPSNVNVAVNGTTVTITCNEAVSDISLPIKKQVRISEVEATLQ